MSDQQTDHRRTHIEMTAHASGRHWIVKAIGHPERAHFLEGAAALDHALRRSRQLRPAVLSVRDRFGTLAGSIEVDTVTSGELSAFRARLSCVYEPDHEKEPDDRATVGAN